MKLFQVARPRTLRAGGFTGVTLGAFLLGTGVVQPARADAGPPGAFYHSAQGTGFARAFCPGKTRVIGGGAFVEQPGPTFKEEKLRQSHPISDRTGVIAFGNTAIGWQAASSDFTDTVVAFVICASGGLASAITSVSYVSAQSIRTSRAFCPTGTTLTGGGAFVETPLGQPFTPQSLRQSYPIASTDGEGASTTTAIGWQASSSDFTEDPADDIVVAFAICAAFTPGVVVEYPSDQAGGLSRAFCSSGTVTGGGAFVQGAGTETVSLRQSHPISDDTGVIAHGPHAIAWQGASSDFDAADQVRTWAICTSW